MSFSIEIYEKENGEVPLEEFISSLRNKLKAKVLRDIDILETKGNTLREPLSSPLKDGLFELRTIQGSDISRVLYFFYYEETIVITNGFIKKRMKTPSKEIERAKEYRQDWIRRHENEILRLQKKDIVR